MQENKNNEYIPENDNSHYTGNNSDIIEKLQKRMNVLYNPSLSEARYIPATKKGEKDTIYIRNDKDIIHEIFHSIARVRRNGVISEKKYNSLYNSLVNSKFFTENILLNEAFKKSLFNEDNGFEPDTAENIGTYDEFYDAMYELYADEYRSDYEKQGYSGNELDNLVSSAVEEEIFAFAFQRFIRKLKDIWNDIVASFKGKESSDIAELKFARKMADKFNRLYRKAEGNAGRTDIGGERFSIIQIKGKTKDYGLGVLLDTDIFDNIKPRNWDKIVNKFVYENLAGKEILVYDETGSTETIHFAKEKERTKKIGAKNDYLVIDKLARIRGNINMLSVIHIDELLETASTFQINNENVHGWLDKNGWEFKRAYLKSKNGDIYETTLNICKARDGRKILYALSNTNRVEVGEVSSSDNGRDSHLVINSNDNKISQNNPGVNSNSMQNSKKDASERKSKQKNIDNLLENDVDEVYNSIKDDLYSELLYEIPVRKIKMKVFPSDKESWSEANQLSVRWAHKDNIKLLD